MKELLKVADEKGFAVPAFNIGSDQLLKAVMQQVKEMKSPVILEMSPDEFNFVENSLIQSMIYEASKTDVPVVIHLDHGDKYETVVRAIQAGFTSVRTIFILSILHRTIASDRICIRTIFCDNICCKRIFFRNERCFHRFQFFQSAF